jgi:hypothetical protein
MIKEYCDNCKEEIERAYGENLSTISGDKWLFQVKTYSQDRNCSGTICDECIGKILLKTIKSKSTVIF